MYPPTMYLELGQLKSKHTALAPHYLTRLSRVLLLRLFYKKHHIYIYRIRQEKQPCAVLYVTVPATATDFRNSPHLKTTLCFRTPFALPNSARRHSGSVVRPPVAPPPELVRNVRGVPGVLVDRVAEVQRGEARHVPRTSARCR